MLCHSQKLAPSPGSQQLFADQREHPPTERQAEQSEQLLHCYNRGRAILLSRFSRVGLFATPWTVALQAPLSMGFTGKNTGVSCHVLLQGFFLTQGSNPCLTSPALAGRFFTTSATWEASGYALVSSYF